MAFSPVLLIVSVSDKMIVPSANGDTLDTNKSGYRLGANTSITFINVVLFLVGGLRSRLYYGFKSQLSCHDSKGILEYLMVYHFQWPMVQTLRFGNVKNDSQPLCLP